MRAMTFIDWFAGIGGFRRGMELAGHKCVGFCEYDKYAVASYTAMHLITEEQREYLLSLDEKKRQKEILKEKYRNGEWFGPDVARVHAGDIPKADCWCFGFPCIDLSIAGRKKGLAGSDSGLFFRIVELLGNTPYEKRPDFLIAENVKNLLGINRGWDFARVLSELDGGGYGVEWQTLDSSCFGVPQSRERVFIVGHLGGGGRQVFPIPVTRRTNRIFQVGMDGTSHRKNPNQYRVYDPSGLAPTLSKMEGGGRQPIVETEKGLRFLTPRECFRLQGWTDEYFDRARPFNSDTQLYKQAGNGVTVPVIETIARRMIV